MPYFKAPIARVAVFALLAVPIALLLNGMVFGGLLALFEGWPYMDGFYYVTGNLTGLATPLTSAQPETNLGKIVDVLIAIWSLSVLGVVIGLMANFSIMGEITTKIEGAPSVQVTTVQDLVADVAEIRYLLDNGGFADPGVRLDSPQLAHSMPGLLHDDRVSMHMTQRHAPT
eukprot:TRINITY_DN5796_c0_g2_i2.p1 TRINITY_DN5796_c0_g2~~TRINITY_DN5796_c0_g2_i2.p1  ORF type:complete len:172 (-),score=41.38 TRINITY_DN5796_c0_g2_i2:111-626(-)